MRLTRRGERLLAALALAALTLFLLGAAWQGQHWKRDRLEGCPHMGMTLHQKGDTDAQM